MVKNGQDIINVTKYGPLVDQAEEGYEEFPDHLINVMDEIKSLENTKNNLYVVLVSKIGDNDNQGDNPYRYSIEKTISFKTLLKYWKDTFGERYSHDALWEKIEARQIIFEAREKQGDGRAARGLHSAAVNYANKLQQTPNDAPKNTHNVIPDQKQSYPKIFIG